MFDVILRNGDRAEAESLKGALFAADTMRREAVEAGATPRIHRETIIVRDGTYDAHATRLAQEGTTIR